MLNDRLKRERLELGKMLDMCRQCSFLYGRKRKGVQDYCESSCHHFIKLQQQRNLVEKLVITDREKRGLSIHGVLFEYERKERCDVIR